MGVSSSSGPSVTSFVVIGDWTDFLLPLGVLLVAGLVIFTAVSAGKRR